mmetsp:Transcript_27326/g.56483  ORF Transcript_27326/g.56483 Transcript_27326/m.56483 type:complete len:313 (+) Transcript_27326:601-1539(+)
MGTTKPMTSTNPIKRDKVKEAIIKTKNVANSLVFPDTALVTLPPKDSIIAFVRSLPRFKPLPPPTSGKMPVRTNTRPASTLGMAPLTPGRGISNRVFPPLLGTILVGAEDVAGRGGWTNEVDDDAADGLLVDAAFLDGGFLDVVVAADGASSSCGSLVNKALPMYPLEKLVILGGGWFFTSSSCCWPNNRRRREIKSINGISLSLACRTLLAPGSLPTTTKFVFPDTPVVTLPPKDSIICFVLSLPRSKPLPPPTSGKIPVRTNFFPASTFGTAPLTPGRGISNLTFSPLMGTILFAEVAGAEGLLCGTIWR